MRPFADALGWVDAYIERMLMAVILVKDEVSTPRATPPLGLCKLLLKWKRLSVL